MNNQKDLVTIIIPVYNVEKYLEECLNSIINQTYNNMEIILIDDGSTDNSVNILKDYARKEDRIKLIVKENTGQGNCRNLALEISNGKYIFFMDSDDYLDQVCIENLIKEIEEKNVDFVIYNGIAFVEKNREKKFYKEKYFNFPKRITENVISGKEVAKFASEWVSPCMKIYKKEFLIKNNIKFDEGIFGEDVIFWFKCCVNATKVTLFDYIGYYRRYRENSVMTSKSSKVIKDRIKGLHLLELLIKDIKEVKEVEEYKYILNGIAKYSNSVFNKIFDYKNYENKILLDYFKENRGDQIIYLFDNNKINKLKVYIILRYNKLANIIFYLKRIKNKNYTVK